jgi:hypothetical protein
MHASKTLATASAEGSNILGGMLEADVRMENAALRFPVILTAVMRRLTTSCARARISDEMGL